MLQSVRVGGLWFATIVYPDGIVDLSGDQTDVIQKFRSFNRVSSMSHILASTRENIYLGLAIKGPLTL